MPHWCFVVSNPFEYVALTVMTTTASFVPETSFGNWFLNTDTWKIHVLCRALNDLQSLLPAYTASYERILDIGCGFGHSFEQLAARFSPQLIVGLDADPHVVDRAGALARQCPVPVELCRGNAAHTSFADASFDMVYCHQSFHHIVAQEAAMAEFHRVLKPGGVLLFAESTRRYIHSWIIRWLFSHPMEVQKTAEEYVAMIRHTGFDLPDSRISLPFLWWSRPDLGALEWMGLPVPVRREETLVNAVAVKQPHVI